MNALKRLNPQLYKLVSQVVHTKHKEQAQRECRELRAVLAELIRRGKTSEELVKVLLDAGTGVATSKRINIEGANHGAD